MTEETERGGSILADPERATMHSAEPGEKNDHSLREQVNFRESRTPHRRL